MKTSGSSTPASAAGQKSLRLDLDCETADKFTKASVLLHDLSSGTKRKNDMTAVYVLCA